MIESPNFPVFPPKPPPLSPPQSGFHPISRFPLSPPRPVLKNPPREFAPCFPFFGGPTLRRAFLGPPPQKPSFPRPPPRLRERFLFANFPPPNRAKDHVPPPEDPPPGFFPPSPADPPWPRDSRGAPIPAFSASKDFFPGFFLYFFFIGKSSGTIFTLLIFPQLFNFFFFSIFQNFFLFEPKGFFMARKLRP